MSPRLPPLSLLKTFEAAARHLSFKKAAEELHVTPAAVSLQIKTLEEALGVRLFQRLTRALALSEAGLAMLPKVHEGLACFDAAVQAVHAEPALALTVTAPPSFASHWLLPRLPSFQAAHPEIALRLASTSEAVDQGGEAPALDKLGRRDAVAIVYGQGGYAGHQVDPLLTPHYLPVCAPALAASLHTPADLRGHTLIHDETTGRWGWHDWLQAAGVQGLGRGQGLHLSNAVLAIDAALAGQGVVLAPRPLVEAQLQADTLRAPYPQALRSPYTYYLVIAPALAQRPAAQAFRQWLLQAMQGPEPATPTSPP